MNKEQQDLLGEAYKNYCKEYENGTHLIGTGLLWMAKETKGTFVYRSKTDSEFSEKWGLKIEEKELSTQERNEWFQIHLNGNNPFMKSDWKDFELDQQNIPTKQITLEYNNEETYYYE
jgi:hypothetical protein